MATPREGVHSATESKTYATITADLDLVTERQNRSPGTGDSADLLPRQILILGGGDLKLEYQSGKTDTIVGIIAPWELNVQPRKILLTGTTVTKVTVLW